VDRDRAATAGVVSDLWRVRRLQRRLDDFAGALLLVAQRAGAAAREAPEQETTS
jgi:hypothetical protein